MTDYSKLAPGDFLQEVGDDAQKWADAFCQHFPGSDRELMAGWFANAIENTWDVRCSRLTRSDGAWQSFREQVERHREMWRELEGQ